MLTIRGWTYACLIVGVCFVQVVSGCADWIAPIDPSTETCGADQPPCVEPFVCSDGLCLRSSEPRCGDGILQTEASEQCDDGNLSDDDRCVNCRITFCGDGVRQTQAGELCDDGNLEHADACTADCAWARCGDGVKRKDSRAGSPDHEDCDDGNAQDRDFCSNDCAAARCGDGWVLEGVELCDDGNINDEDDCSNTCGLGVVELDSGTGYTCGRTERGRVTCWGANEYGQLGDGTLTDRASPTLIPGLVEVTRLALNNKTSCALTGADQLWCWGDTVGLSPQRLGVEHRWQDVTSFTLGREQQIVALDSDGQLFRVRTQGVERMPQPEPLAAIAGGSEHVCGYSPAGRVYCFGSNADGQVGLNDGGRVALPTYMGLDNIRSIGALSNASCAVDTQGGLWCWGRSYHRGVPLTVTPRRLDNVPEVASVKGSRDAAIIRLASGELYMFDPRASRFYRNDNVQPEAIAPFMPQRRPPGYDQLLDAVAQPDYRCAVSSARRVACWGRSSKGRLGLGILGYYHRPQRIPGITQAEQVVVGTAHTCVRLAGGAVRCWGKDDLNQRGSGVNLSSETAPTLVPGLEDAQSLTGSSSATCALTSGGGAECWGRVESEPDEPPFSLLNPGSAKWTALEHSFLTLCGIDDQGVAKCWGVNQFGELGDGTQTVRDAAEPVLGLPPVVSLTGASTLLEGRYGSHYCARDAQGMVWCWGGNGWTESGSQNPANPTLTLEAQRIGDVGATRLVRAMPRKTCAVTEDGRSICWGSGCGVGALGVSEAGDPHNAQRRAIEGLAAVPTDFVGGTCWTCALLESGEVSCWGDGSDGELGNGDALISPTPMTVSGLPKIKQVDGRWAQICAVSETGEVFCWGRNDNYQILPPKHAYVFENGSLNTPAELSFFGGSETF